MRPPVKFWNTLSWFFLCLSITSCAVWRPSVLEKRKIREEVWLQAIETWQMEGRIGVKGGTENWHGHLLWKHGPAVDYMLLSGPLGQGGVAVWISKNLIKVDRGNGDVQISNQPEVFIKELFGVDLPFRSMHHWVLGRPVPAIEHTVKYRPDGRLHELYQGVWSVLYERYIKVGEGSLPEKILIKGPDKIRLKLIIHHWQVNV